jgi:arsenate reductase
VYAALKESGVAMESVNYYTDPIPPAKLRDLLRKMGLSARALLRTKEPVYRELGLATRTVTEDELIALMSEHPDLIQRPIVERGDRAILARPAEKLREIL